MFFKFVKKALNENQTFIKFIFIGIINTIFGYGIYLLFLLIGFNFVIAALLSTILGIIFNFFTTGRFVFKSTNNYLILKFVMVYIFIYLFTISGLSILYLYGISYEIGGALMLAPNALLSFFLNKRLVFNEKNN
jgi:putative flippase GtrA|tara:strand:+ start:66 stop:467 length:402 start_codon:yes stop_codon:yes gene_type:complete